MGRRFAIIFSLMQTNRSTSKTLYDSVPKESGQDHARAAGQALLSVLGKIINIGHDSLLPNRYLLKVSSHAVPCYINLKLKQRP
jgi:hypothetical protein